MKKVVMYTDGGCIRNPGPGGYGVVLKYNKFRCELSGGYQKTTNNRMEIIAVIQGLKMLKGTCIVTIYSDSQYLVNSMMKGWARRWRTNNWMRNKKDPALNPDLWEELLTLCEKHQARFIWIQGHSGNSENERCDQLCKEAIEKGQLKHDWIYEKSR